MGTTTMKNQCMRCEKKAVSKCSGCSRDYCFDHFSEHREEFIRQFHQLENRHNLHRQTVMDQRTNPEKHSLVQEIDQWENESIEKIRQKANESKRLVVKYLSQFTEKLEQKLKQLTEAVERIRDENNYNEIELNQLKTTLNELEEELNKPLSVTIEEEQSSAFIKSISVEIDYGKYKISTVSFRLLKSFLRILAQVDLPDIPINTQWIQDGMTIAGGNEQGDDLAQLNFPHSIYLDDDDDQTLYIADHTNHRIISWKSDGSSGQVVAGGNGKGNRNDQLNGPANVILDKKTNALIICDLYNRRLVRWNRQDGASGETILGHIHASGVVMDNDGYLYISDANNHEVKRWKIGDANGIVVAGGNGRGSSLNQLSRPYYICIDDDHSVYVSDYDNHRVVKWIQGAREGIVVAGGRDKGNDLTQLSRPCGLVVDQSGTMYIADAGNNRIMSWAKDANQGNIVLGGNRRKQISQFNWPCDLAFDRQNHLYVLDSNNHRVQKFSVDSY